MRVEEKGEDRDRCQNGTSERLLAIKDRGRSKE